MWQRVGRLDANAGHWWVWLQALQEAIAEQGQDAFVLDIGSGSGLLAMLAAQAGAAEVVTVEANPDFAK